MFLEAKAELKALVQLFKDTLADPEKHMGRLNKEDKVLSGKKLCRKNLSCSWLNFVKVYSRVSGHGSFAGLFIYLVLIPVSCFVVLFSVLETRTETG